MDAAALKPPPAVPRSGFRRSGRKTDDFRNRFLLLGFLRDDEKNRRIFD